MTAGITYEIGENKIGGGIYVKALPRCSEPVEPVYGFKSHVEADAWIEADRAKSRQTSQACSVRLTFLRIKRILGEEQ